MSGPVVVNNSALLYAHRRNLPKRVRVFMEWTGEILGPVLAR